jgi:hypothetical protein
MNMRSLAVILGALTAAALSACTVESTTSSTSAGGGSNTTTGVTSTSGSNTGGSGGSGGDATTSSTSTGTGMCDPTYACVDAIAQGSGDPAELCDGPALDEFNALADCTCTGNCATECADSACKQLDPSAECKACLSTKDTGCGKEFDACINGT